MQKSVMSFFAIAACTINFCFSQIVGTPPIPTYLPQNGLVGWWPFDGNANDMSGNNNNGTPTSTTQLTNDRFNRVNSAYQFDGFSSKIEIPDAASLRVRKITMSAWIKTNDSLKTQQIIYKGDMLANGEQYSLTMVYQGKPGGCIKGNNNCIAVSAWDAGALAPQPITNSKWYHLVYTYDGAIGKLYQNGTLVDSATGLGLINTCNLSELKFGYNHTGWGNSGDVFNGVIDDIAIWNRDLSETEISSFYNACLNDCGYGNLGINVCNPKRNFHIKDVLRLEPRDAPPLDPEEGDIYYDKTLHKLRVYDGSMWQNCF